MQRRATYLVDGVHHMSYSERLKKLNLPLLVYRKAWGDMTEVFNYFHFYDNCTLLENFKPRNHPSRKHNYQMLWKAPKDGMRELQAIFFSASEWSKPGMTSQKKSYMPSLIIKIWRGIDLLFQNRHKELDEFWLEHLEVSKIYTLMGCFWPKHITCELKIYRGVIFHETLESDAKVEEILTSGLGNDIRSLPNFHQSTWKSQNWDFDGILLSKAENVWA